jgi:glycine cleavage system aminomethyltransferase T
MIFLLPPSNDFAHVKAEVLGVRNGVGVTEIANFAKYRFSGHGAENFLSRMMTNKMPKVGRLILTPMLNPNGKLIGDFIANAGNDTFIYGVPAGAEISPRWFEQHVQGRQRAFTAMTWDSSGFPSPGRSRARFCKSSRTRMFRTPPSNSWTTAPWISAMCQR